MAFIYAVFIIKTTHVTEHTRTIYILLNKCTLSKVNTGNMKKIFNEINISAKPFLEIIFRELVDF